jgi:hypothetical protein
MGALQIDISVQERVLYMMTKDKTIVKLVDMFKERQDSLLTEIKALEYKLSTPEPIQWIPVSAVAEEKGLTSDTVRKQLRSGAFEEGVDFKKPHGRILINQGAIERICRKRRNSNA